MPKGCALSPAEGDLQQRILTLYSEHHGWLSGWLRRKMGCAHYAADLAHDTFVRIMSARPELAEIREPRAYLTTTAQRLLIDRSRRQAVEDACLTEWALSAAHGSAPSPEEFLQMADTLDMLCRALELVSHKAREAFIQHFLEGEPQAVVAERLGVSTRTVRTYLVDVLIHCNPGSEAA
ncbi:sigma-70 family RNA polymerase sigma factor [Paludibacterium paludis]|uniref:RNA polymerase sigma factor n=1 Tax=Paludibacterium paludis TaxID=1225769 RepID=A0A918P169_9NEIS|nr:sigma-70 family RNA polymerase sigma factor [Paludibacterium paludis]GGY09916.1 RNA polymerase sigma factor [Paludibacterium paludis]